MDAATLSVGLAGGRLNADHQAMQAGQTGSRISALTSENTDCTCGRLRRRVDRFRRAGLLEPLPGVTIEQAVTAEELWQAYALVHDVFVCQNYILPQQGGVRLRAYEAVPEMATFVAKADGRVVAVMSVVPDSPELGLPSDKAFHHELELLRASGRRIAEVTNLAVAPEYRNTSVFFELSRCCIAHGLNIGLDDAFVSISPGHAMFFEAVMGFEPWGERRNYGGQVEDMVEGMRLNLRTVEERMIEADKSLGQEAFLYDFFFTHNPHFHYTKASAEIASQKFMDPTVLRRLFGVETGFLQRCSSSVLEALEQRWGGQRFACVSAGLALEAQEPRQRAA